MATTKRKPWFVSRQSYWGVDPEDQHTVEIATGGIDYANPDMLVPKYPGEGQEYEDPREAAEAAIAICQAWRKDRPNETIGIAHGYTAGCTMPFEHEQTAAEHKLQIEQMAEDGRLDDEQARAEIEGFDEWASIRQWAQEQWDKLPKCDGCSDLLPADGTHYMAMYFGRNDAWPLHDDCRYCSEQCAEKNSQWEETEDADAETCAIHNH